MLAPVVLLSSVCVIVFAQNNANDPISWGWHMSPAGPGTIGHYFVKLPQSEQQVRYLADGSGYHSSLSVTTSDPQHHHSTNIALGEKAVELSGQTPVSPQLNLSQTPFQNSGQTPTGVYFLQQEFPYQAPYTQTISNQPNFIQYSSIPNHYYSDRGALNPYYNIQTHNQDINNNYEINREQKQTDINKDEIIETRENGPVVVFKDNKCKNDEGNTQTNNINKVQNENIQETLAYNTKINGNFGEKDNKLITSHSNSKEFHYDTEIDHYSTSRPVIFTQDEGISRLVASTQDLISNDDLLRINHAAERFIHYSDDLIKPKRKSSSISFKTNNGSPRSRITVTAKVGKIVDSNVEHPFTLTKNPSKEYNYQTERDIKFASPIIVEDQGDYKEQILNNFISSVTPYINDGYQIIGVKKNINNTHDNKEDLVNITPRPISQHYLTPITVALRLLNDNSTQFSDLVDHEPSDSEFVERTVQGPRKGKTLVEIQESIPIDITHINDVEYHEYLEDGRINREQPRKVYYQRYQPNSSDKEKHRNNYDNYHNSDKKENQDEHIDDKNVRGDQIQSNTDHDDAYYTNKMIQPIIIEKPVPVNTFVDRFVEKPSDRDEGKPVEITKYIDKPYPVEVIKPYPVEVRVPYPVEHKVYVDRPIHVPYTVEKVVEKQMIHPFPVPTPVGIPVAIPVEKNVIYPVAFETPVPVAVPIEKPVTVEKVIEKKIAVPYPVEKKIPIPVEVPKPYPVDRIIEKKVPFPIHVNRIVEKRVPVQVPYPVKQIVEKIVEKPVVVTKYVDKPYPVEKRVPYPVDRIVERKVPYPVHIPYEVPYFIEKNNQKSEHPYQFEKNDKVTTLYSYGVSQEALQRVADYLKLSHEDYKQQALDQYTQTPAETKTNYQIQPANAHVLKNIQNITPVYKNLEKQYASSYTYNTTRPTHRDVKYYGPAPVDSYDESWEKNKEYTESLRRTERMPKVSDVRIEYGFKPPLRPSTEIDLNGVPIKKDNS
ncbi:unnamed protein product [Danaus chrysippus]|uniref:(African queen) hypothetical protein n=1 Tax=Danaus chrysippus TaxID=151541 RepID=A0A8J2QXI0_9NEOP|nr:unnamed protein product [Danaus chrysippus]